ncbi:MAG: indole-3-glycerol-phosphate synthase [Deltaproteobacteria bacterium]|nr:MAG: indole-3-glycerol-phosphate synthase [Deltaproteobacteria bacterium]
MGERKFLDTILEVKRREVEEALIRWKGGFPERGCPIRPVNLKREGKRKIIAEIKKRSPSRGPLREGLSVAGLTREYTEGGAAAISVLTDSIFFGGGLGDLEEASRNSETVPLLRKDFVIDGVQVEEAYAAGADLVLLIARILSRKKLESLIRQCREKGLVPLVEVHDEREMEMALEAGADHLGVNNRDLDTFTVDLNVSRRLIPKIPEGCVKIVESGISDRAVMEEMEDLGADAFLIGEALVTAPFPGERLRYYLKGK